jgi:cold shock CspA family protein
MAIGTVKWLNAQKVMGSFSPTTDRWTFRPHFGIGNLREGQKLTHKVSGGGKPNFRRCPQSAGAGINGMRCLARTGVIVPSERILGCP